MGEVPGGYSNLNRAPVVRVDECGWQTTSHLLHCYCISHTSSNSPPPLLPHPSSFSAGSPSLHDQRPAGGSRPRRGLRLRPGKKHRRKAGARPDPIKTPLTGAPGAEPMVPMSARTAEGESRAAHERPELGQNKHWHKNHCPFSVFHSNVLYDQRSLEDMHDGAVDGSLRTFRGSIQPPAEMI